MASNAVIISADNRGPWIIIVTWILCAVMCLASFIKVISKWVMSRKTQYDDLYIVAAAILTIAYDIAISLQVRAGLGKNLSVLNIEQFIRYEQTGYASQILYLASLFLAKMAVLQFTVSLARIETRRLVVKGVMSFNLISTVIAIFAVALQCALPRPWAVSSNSCFQQAAFWDSFGTMDAIVDLATALLPIYLLRDLQLPWSRKIPVMVSFASRALMIPIIVVRLVYLNSASKSVNHPLDDFSTVMSSSVQANLSVIVSCMPFIKPVMDSLETGILACDVHTTASARKQNYALRWLGSSSAAKGDSGFNKPLKKSRQGNSTTATSGGYEGQRERGLSIGSEERMIIKQTKTVAINIEP